MRVLFFSLILTLLFGASLTVSTEGVTRTIVRKRFIPWNDVEDVVMGADRPDGRAAPPRIIARRPGKAEGLMDDSRRHRW